jgi:hypothetical protein
MAELLFQADDLRPQACERLAVSLGIPASAYRAGLATGKIDPQIDANLVWVRRACPDGLPGLWVQDRRLPIGTDRQQMSADLRDAITAAQGEKNRVQLSLSELR